MQIFSHFALMALATLASLLLGAAVLHTLPKLGPAARRLSDALCRAPGLDWVVGYFMVLPVVVGPAVFGWIGLLAALAGQVAGILIWCRLHELANRHAVKGPRIVKVLNHLIGPLRNHAALWLTAAVTPLFFLVRMAEIFIYPPLAALVGFPRYDAAQWVTVSRQKFTGLVGHDLIWCLYCDWMTGLWSLGTEILRNVESFWCPIRFADGKKCANCKIDFPDVDNGWIAADGTMAQVAEKLEQMHAHPPHAWFGHPVRLTIKGNDPANKHTSL